MSSLSKEQLEELWELIGTRRAEFSERGSPHFMFVPLSHGEVRMIYDAIEEWQCAHPQPMVELSAPGVADTDMMDGYHIGWERGRESLRKELGLLEQAGGWVGTQAAKEQPAPPKFLTPEQREKLAEALSKFIVKPNYAEPERTDPEQIRADIRDYKAYPDLEPEPNGDDVFAGVHPVAGGAGAEPIDEPPTAVEAETLYLTKGDVTVMFEMADDSPPPPVSTPLPEPTLIPIVTNRASPALKAASERVKEMATNGNGHHAEPSPAAVATLGPEHTVVTPIVPRRPRTLAEVDADTTKDKPAPSLEKEAAAEEIRTMRMDATQRAAQLREIVGYLQDMAEGNEMPSMATWNEKKPAHLPKADALTHRYSLNWAELARYCHLDFQGKRGPKPTFKHPLHRVSA